MQVRLCDHVSGEWGPVFVCSVDAKDDKSISCICAAGCDSLHAPVIPNYSPDK